RDRPVGVVEQQLGQLGVEVVVQVERGGQVPGVGERVGGGDAEQRRGGHLSEAGIDGAFEGPVGLERGQARRGGVGVPGAEVAGRRAVAGVGELDAVDGCPGPVLGADHVIDQLADVPLGTRRGCLQLVGADLGEQPGGDVLGLGEGGGFHGDPPAMDWRRTGAATLPKGSSGRAGDRQWVFSMKRSTSTTTRVTLPAATRPRSSRAETWNSSRRPSTFSRLASARTTPPMAVGEMCSSWTRIPTVDDPSSRWPSRARTVASSTNARMRGVASTGTSPDRMAMAVSASDTVRSMAADSPV